MLTIEFNFTKMNKIRLYWEFHKSTLLLNYGSSFIISLLAFPIFYIIFTISIASGGAIISYLYKEISCKKEFYFYFNKGINKTSLFVISFILNAITAILLNKLLHNVQHS